MPSLARQERDRIGAGRVFMVSADPRQSAALVDREAPAFKARRQSDFWRCLVPVGEDVNDPCRRVQRVTYADKSGNGEVCVRRVERFE